TSGHSANPSASSRWEAANTLAPASCKRAVMSSESNGSSSTTRMHRFASSVVSTTPSKSERVGRPCRDRCAQTQQHCCRCVVPKPDVGGGGDVGCTPPARRRYGCVGGSAKRYGINCL